ncbi:MAG: hypothetical protein DRJ03_19710 [Chloroflexi bacterium]|nr:MAG: hypothetical protein DRJ03_19710 [Chloroflexota bacterium]
MTDFGRRTGEGDMKKSVYDTNDDGVVDVAESTPTHANSHEAGGTDEISVAGLSGELADDQPPKAHALGGAEHTADTLENLNAKVSDATLDDASAPRTPTAHKTSHQDSGSDEIDCTGLAGRINYVDRGDPAAWDWTVSDFTTDGNWHDLDCSAIVPAGAKAIIFRIHITDDLVGTYFQLRKNGNTNSYSSVMEIVNEANRYNNGTHIVPCDEDRIVEYRTTNTTIDAINVLVMGWFI